MHVEMAHPTEDEYKEIMSWKDNATMPKRLKRVQKGFCYMETQRMHNEDRLSDLRGALERKPVVEEKIVVQEKIVL